MESKDHFRAARLALRKAQEEREKRSARKAERREPRRKSPRFGWYRRRKESASTEAPVENEPSNEPSTEIEDSFKRLEKKQKVDVEASAATTESTVRIKSQAQRSGKGKSVLIVLLAEASVRSKNNVPDFFSAASKLYLPEDAKELDKLKSVELYEEAVVNCFKGLELIVGMRCSSFAPREQLKELRSNHSKLLTEKGESDREISKLKEQLGLEKAKARKMSEQIDSLQAAIVKHQSESEPLRSRVWELEAREQTLTLDLANERAKFTSLEGDIAEVEVTTQVDMLKKIISGKLTKSIAQAELDLLSSFIQKGNTSDQT